MSKRNEDYEEGWEAACRCLERYFGQKEVEAALEMVHDPTGCAISRGARRSVWFTAREIAQTWAEDGSPIV